MSLIGGAGCWGEGELWICGEEEESGSSLGVVSVSVGRIAVVVLSLTRSPPAWLLPSLDSPSSSSSLYSATKTLTYTNRHKLANIHTQTHTQISGKDKPQSHPSPSTLSSSLPPGRAGSTPQPRKVQPPTRSRLSIACSHEPGKHLLDRGKPIPGGACPRRLKGPGFLPCSFLL